MTLEEGIRLRDTLWWGLLKLAPMSQERFIQHVNEYYSHIECYYPRYERTIRPNGARGKKKVWWPVFPGYVFMHVRKGDLYEMVNLPVRAYWVRFGGSIELIPDRVIEKIKELEEKKELVREVRYVEQYRHGVGVRVHLPVGDILAVVVKCKGDRVIVEAPLGRCVVPRHMLELS
jgi:hypothetical protein